MNVPEELDLFEFGEIFPIESIVDTGKKGEPYDSVMSEMETYTDMGTRKGSYFYGIGHETPQIGWGPSVIQTPRGYVPIDGINIKGWDDSKYINEVGYSPFLIFANPRKRKKVGMHEGFHAVQKGGIILSWLKYDLGEGKFKFDKEGYPVGDMLNEGSVELGLENELDVETPYPISLNFTKEINRHVGIRKIYRLARVAEEKLGGKLKEPYFNPTDLKRKEAPRELIELLYEFNKSPEIQQIAHRYAIHSKTDIPYIV